MTSSLMPSNVDLSTMSTDLEKCLRWPAKDPVWFMPTYPGHDVQTCRPPCVSSQRLPWPPVSSESTFPREGEPSRGSETAPHGIVTPPAPRVVARTWRSGPGANARRDSPTLGWWPSRLTELLGPSLRTLCCLTGDTPANLPAQPR